MGLCAVKSPSPLQQSSSFRKREGARRERGGAADLFHNLRKQRRSREQGDSRVRAIADKSALTNESALEKVSLGMGLVSAYARKKLQARETRCFRSLRFQRHLGTCIVHEFARSRISEFFGETICVTLYAHHQTNSRWILDNNSDNSDMEKREEGFSRRMRISCSHTASSHLLIRLHFNVAKNSRGPRGIPGFFHNLYSSRPRARPLGLRASSSPSPCLPLCSVSSRFRRIMLSSCGMSRLIIPRCNKCAVNRQDYAGYDKSGRG